MTREKKPQASEWKRMRFKKNKVWLATQADGSPIVKVGKVLIKYQLEQDYEYWVNKASVVPLDSPPQPNPRGKGAQEGKKPLEKSNRHTRTEPSEEKAGADTICIYTDGASSGNPGPSGIGVVLRFGAHEKEISEYIGFATNNIAELKAIQTGLSAVKKTDFPVKIYTDSNYAYGVLALGWKSRKNKEIVESIKKRISKFKNLTFIKVKGHAGDEGNEQADFLATSAIKNKGIPT